MSVTVTSPISAGYVPNGATRAFAFNFKAASAAEIAVYQVLAGVWTLINPSAYAVVLAGGEGGTVTFTVAPVAGTGTIYVVSAPWLTQTLALANDGPFTPSILNGALDRAAIRAVFLNFQANRSLKVPLNETDPGYPDAADRANNYLTHDGAGKPVPGISNAGIAGMLSDISTNATNIGNEATTRANADTAETAARVLADNGLAASIATETGARVTAVNTEAATRASADTAEATARANAVSGEATTRAAGDAALGTRIDGETAGRSSADAAILAAIVGAGGTLTNVTINAADRTILAALSHALPAYLAESGREGQFVFYTSANYAAAFGSTLAADLAIDTQQGVLIAHNDGTGAWVRRHGGKVTPYHFGAVGKIEGQTTGWVDDAPALNAWAAWLVSRVNRRIVGEAHGKFVINSQVTFGSRVATTTRGVEIIGSWELFANAAMDRMLETGRIEFFQITGQLHLWGGGPNTDSGDVTWANRLAKVGWYNFGCSHTNVDVFHARFMSVAGYFTAASTGIESTDSSRFGTARPHYCGSGVIGTDSLQANYSAPNNNGVALSPSQTTTITVDAIPPTYLTDITGGNTAFNGGRALPIGAFVNGRVYQVTAVDATHINLFPWLDSTAPATGTITYIFGAGFLDRGSDANVYEIGLLDAQNNGVGIWDLALYGPHIDQIQASANGVGYMAGSTAAGSSIGGGFESMYPEGNTADLVVFSNFATGTIWKNGNFGWYEGNLAKCYVALVPRAADNSFPADQSLFATVPMTYNGARLTPQGHPGNNLYYGKASIDWTLATIPQVYAGMGATTINIHPPLSSTPGGVRPNDDWAGLADLNRLYGHDSCICTLMGTGAAGAPSGPLTFQAANLSRQAVVTNGSAVVTGLASTTGLVAGMFAQASGSGATTILSVDSPTQITLTAAATANATSIKLPGTSVNGAASAVFSSFNGVAVFAAYYRFSTNDIIVQQVGKPLTATATYDPPNLTAGTVDTAQSITVTGAALGDEAEATFSLDLQGLVLAAWVSAANTVKYQFRNPSGGATVNLASGTVKAVVRKA